ncbi:MAG: DNA translocase FtsK 4TM domain-containing protein, partial [Clostridia bacterium]|nr:DNA translocase FtsK 4TM domain-containing protein [Clostridia bacterium]
MAREVSKNKKKTSSAKSAPKAKKNVNYDFVAIIIIAIGLFVGASFIGITGPVGEFVKNSLLGLFGGTAYLLCFAAIACSVHYIIKRGMGKTKKKYILTGFLIVFLCVFWHIVDLADEFDEGIVNVVAQLWERGIENVGGGLIGGLIGIPMYKLLNYWGSMIVLIAAILILLIAIFNVSLENVFNRIKGWFSKGYDAISEEEVENVPENMPPEMQKELKKLKKQIFDFEKEFSEMPE